jgi:hypothetical protein
MSKELSEFLSKFDESHEIWSVASVQETLTINRVAMNQLEK